MSARYETFVNRHLSIASKAGDEWMAICVFHNDSNASLQINVEKGLYICFACGARGSIKSLERHFGVRVVEDMLDVQDIRARIDALRNPQAEVLPVLDESFLSRWKFPSPYWGQCGDDCPRRCHEHRGLKPSTIASFDLGADPMGEYVTIPIRNINGGLLGVIKRYLGEDDEIDMRYRYPRGFKKSHHLFGSWLVQEDDDADFVVLTEGSIDAMKVWQAGYPAMAILGSSLSAIQTRVIRRLGIKKVVLFFDNDKAGKKVVSTCRGFHEFTHKGKTRVKYVRETDLRREFFVEVATYGRGFPPDPGAMSEDQIDSALRNARKM